MESAALTGCTASGTDGAPDGGLEEFPPLSPAFINAVWKGERSGETVYFRIQNNRIADVELVLRSPPPDPTFVVIRGQPDAAVTANSQQATGSFSISTPLPAEPPVEVAITIQPGQAHCTVTFGQAKTFALTRF